MEFYNYIGKNLIGWLYYNPEYENENATINRVCYVYPRVCFNNNTYEMINSKEDFPKNGRIEVKVQGGDTSEDVFRDVGNLVSFNINVDTAPNEGSNNYYSLKYNPKYDKRVSEIWIERFNGKDFYQIIDVYEDIEKIKREHQIDRTDLELFTNHIILRINNKLYGPFEYDIKEKIISLKSLQEFQYYIKEYEALEINDELCIIEDNNDMEKVVLLPKRVLRRFESTDTYDWISTKKLQESFIESLKAGNQYTGSELRELKESVLELMRQNSSVAITSERADRIKRTIHELTERDEYIETILQYIFEDENLKEKLADAVVSNHLEAIKSEILQNETVSNEIENLENEKRALKENIMDLKNKESEMLPRLADQSSDEITALNEQLADLKGENDNLKERLDLEKSIEELTRERDDFIEERDRAHDDYEKKLVEKNRIKDELNEILQDFNDNVKVAKKALDSKLLNQILSNISEENDEQAPEAFNINLLSQDLNSVEIIERVRGLIKDVANRDVSFNDVANYLICLTQGFITTFAGEPGTGKTSLCNLLAKALGLARNDAQCRFIDISVERGWTSHKDFIGYYNPLTKSMEKSNEEVYDAFLRLNEETALFENEIAPFIILLDEANLSPIEHYWAAFLKNCDFDSTSNRRITLGGPTSYKLPEHLRFLATVNFDHTTEELSPRFLDRSWIITLEPTKVVDEPIDIPENMETMIPYLSLKEAFGISNGPIDEPIAEKWNSIQNIFKSEACSLPIMPRNLKMVRNYCAAACQCMNRDTPFTKLAPLDYAFSQKILPTINGSGERYQVLIDELLKECTEMNMPLSARHLNRMKRVGENNMGFYQFFAR